MIKLRDLALEDLDDLVKWRNDPNVSRHLADRLTTRAEAVTWFNRLKAIPKIWLKGIVYEEQRIGYAAVEAIDEKNRKCELALIIGRDDLWGRGIGKAVMGEMLTYAFETIGMYRVWAVATEGNDRSVRLLEATGMINEGALRQSLIVGDKFTDLLCYSMLEEEYRSLIDR